MRLKNNWDMLRPSKQQIEARKIVQKQKVLTIEELREEGDKAYEAMVSQKAKKTTLN